jgi:galactitol-specific phosphotransferase system IIB component
MPTTDAARSNLHDRRVIGKIDIKDRFLDYLEQGLLRYTKAMTSGPSPDPDVGGWFSSITATDGTGSSVTFSSADGGLYGTDGTGSFLSVENADARITNVPFQNTGAITYYMGVRHAEVPEGISIDTATGALNYDRYRQEIGHSAAPSTVTDNGDGTITFALLNHRLHASDTYTGRSAIVYLVDPVSASPTIAIETCTVTGTSITTVSKLGQTSVSTTAADYLVVLVGPSITRSSTLATQANWAFIGTVVGGGSPKTFDFSGQSSLVPLLDLSQQSQQLNFDGWITEPTPTIGGGGANVSFGTGIVLVNGRIKPTPASGTIGPLGVSTEFWITWNDGTGSYQKVTTWDAANAANCVPVFWGHTDGGSLITTQSSGLIGKMVQKFPHPLLITVSADTAHHGAFQSVRQALSAARSAQQGSTITPPGIVIELVGDVTATLALNDADQLSVSNVLFVGRGGGQARAAVPGAGKSGARLKWSFQGSLFEVGAGAVISGWTFKDLTFQFTGTANSEVRAVISNTGGTINGLTFENCTVDGNTVLNAVDAGAGTGALSHLLYSNNGIISNLTVKECGVYTRGAAIYQASATGGLVKLRIIDSEFVANAAGLFSTTGIVADASTSANSSNWRIRGCDTSGHQGAIVQATRIHGMWITDCDFQNSTADAPVLDFGRNSASADIDSIWVGASKLTRTGQTNPATPIVRVRGEGTVRFFNYATQYEDGDIAGGSARAVSFAANTTPISGPILFGNSVHFVENGFVSDTGDLKQVIVFGNNLDVSNAAYKTYLTEHIVFGNRMRNAGETDAALTVFGENHSIFGNAFSRDVDTNYCVLFDSGSEFCSFVGNVVAGVTAQPLTLDGDSHTVVGNVLVNSTAPGGASPLTLVPAGATTNIFVGNQMFNFTGNGAGAVLVGNNVENALSYENVNFVITGNRIFSLTSAANSNDVVISGNHIDTTMEQEGSHVVLGGNWIDGATYDFKYTNSAITGNVFPSATAFSLNAASDDVAVIGNYINDATVTDAGTNNVQGGADTNTHT